MVKVYDVDQDKLVKELALKLKEDSKISMPEWAKFVKTGPNKERNPSFNEWWHFRAASILKKIYTHGPIGVAKLRTKYGGKKNMGVAPEKFVRASGKIIRVILQQLESAGYVKKEEKNLHKGRKIAPKGTSLIDKVAGSMYQAQSKKNKSSEESNVADKVEKNASTSKPEEKTSEQKPAKEAK